MRHDPEIIPLQDINDSLRPLTGGKAANLATLANQGFPISPGFCITTALYRHYIAVTDIAPRVAIELNRKPFQEMRWEELWDCALRIRHIFITTDFPQSIEEKIRSALAPYAATAMVVRSSATREDSPSHSFAGLHESYVNISGIDNLLHHIRLVWASLWSDRALLYLKELNLSPADSTIAVIVQQWLDSEVSGVAFGQDPTNPNRVVIEAVPGQNQALVDGSREPHRWFLGTPDGNILSSTPEDSDLLTPNQLSRVFLAVQHCGHVFGSPQDVEWTLVDNTLYLLQSRPITSNPTHGETAWQAEDKRPWYLSLTKSFHHLQTLKVRIENEIIPQMDHQAAQMAGQDLNALDNPSLARELEHRLTIYRHWADTYYRELIPFAHGVRLFGQIYNDTIKPGNPFDFTKLLTATGMTSLRRNRRLKQLAELYLKNPSDELLASFLQEFGDLTFDNSRLGDHPDKWKQWLTRIAQSPIRDEDSDTDSILRLQEEFIDAFLPEKQNFARQLLDIARASYQLRDNDNIHLAKIEARLIEAQSVARARVDSPIAQQLDTTQLIQCLLDPTVRPTIRSIEQTTDEPPDKTLDPTITRPTLQTVSGPFSLKARQIRGQPAGNGLAQGPARVVSDTNSLFSFQQGEILVCDSIDPNMTFVVPLAAAIVERRGGMLVHGAIIAREYGLPCVTGIPNALDFIQTGAQLTVDGYLGIVTIHE